MAALSRLIERLLPALLLASSVTLLAGGVFAYAPPRPAGDGQPSPSLEPGSPIEAPAPTPSGGQATPPIASATWAPNPTASGPPASPTVSPGPGPTSRPTDAAEATRIVIVSLGIDLPVVRGDLEVPGNRNQYPLCDVAQFLVDYAAPGEAGSAYLYAHARSGMFLPLLEASQRNDGAEMIGALVEVYTADLRRHLYEVFLVKRHATDLSLADDVAPGQHRLVLQTSEGPRGTIPKLQVAAEPVGVFTATAQEALPEPAPTVCR